MKEKPHLYGSAPTLEMLLEGIKNFYYNSDAALIPRPDGTWAVSTPKKGIHENVRVRQAGKRFRFERITPIESIPQIVPGFIELDLL